MLINDSSLYIDAGLLKDLYQGSVSKDKLCILAERQLNELMHAMKCKCAGRQVPEKIFLYCQFDCTTTRFISLKIHRLVYELTVNV